MNKANCLTTALLVIRVVIVVIGSWKSLDFAIETLPTVTISRFPRGGTHVTVMQLN